MKVKHFILFISFFLFLKGNSQNDEVKDSLIRLISKAPDDTNKVNLILKLGQQYGFSESKNRIENYIEALNLSKKINYNAGRRKIYIPLISYLFQNNMFNSSSDYCAEYFDFCEKNKLNDEKYAMFNMMGNLLCRQQKYAEALKYYNSKRSYDLQSEDYKSYATSMNNMSIWFFDNKQYDSALVYSLWAIEMFKRNNMAYEMANSVLGISRIYFEKEDFEKAEEKANEAYTFYSVNNDRIGMCNSLSVLGSVYAYTNKLDSAYKTFSKAILYSDSLNLINVQRDCYEGLSEMYRKHKNYKDAYEYNILFERYEDSVAVQFEKGRMLELEVKYDMAKKENGLKQYEIKEKSNARTFLFISILGFILLIAVSFKAFVKK